jgi:hypothetical protein
MKTTLKLFFALTAVAVTSLFSVQPAQADYMVTLAQVGSNVVATGSGAINTTGLGPFGTATGDPEIDAMLALIATGPTGSNADIYSGPTGPTSFGSGSVFHANSGSGNLVGINGTDRTLFVPHNYVSNTALTSSATWNNATFASLGVTPGTYVWTWGTGLANQSFTLQIGPAGVPDSGSTVSLLGCALLGLAALRRKLSC